MTLTLVKPALDYLPAYADALTRGWSPDTMRAAAREEELAKIAEDPDGFVRALDDPEARGASIVLPDGSNVPRLPGFRRWLWDGEFCGSIGFRWQRGSNGLPPHCLGHIGYAVVPWKSRRGYATRALGLLLPECAAQGLDFIELTTDPDNIASQKVILANGGVLFERFVEPASLGGGEGLRFRIGL